jgi:pyruvate dehydrogenase E1 component beta subunit
VASGVRSIRSSQQSKASCSKCKSDWAGVLQMTVREALNSAIDEEMARDPDVFVLGEEVCGLLCGVIH